MIFHDVFDNEPEVGRVQIRVEGVYIWPFRQLRMVANRYDTNCFFYFVSNKTYYEKNNNEVCQVS